MLKRVLVILSIIFAVLLLFAYIFLSLLAPHFLSKPFFKFSAFNNEISIKNLKIKSDFKLNYSISADSVLFDKNNNQTLNLKGLTGQLSLFDKNNNQINVEKLTFNKTHFERSNQKNNFDPLKLPDLFIQNAEISLLNPDKSFAGINLYDFLALKDDGKINFTFKGDINTDNISILTYPKRNFGDNFKDYSGKFSGNLTYSHKNLDGYLEFQKLSAVWKSLFVPVEFKNASFVFDKRSVYFSNTGLLGGEKAKTTFYITDIFEKNKEVSGTVSAEISSAFSKKYVDDFLIKNKILLNVEYLVKNRVANVFYYSELPVDSDIYYHGTRLGLIDKKRKFQAITRKKGDIIELLKYSYLVEDDNKEDEIIFGSAKFSKKNGRYTIDKLSGETKKDAPVSLLGFLENRLKGGFFNGILEYDFNRHKLFGSISLTDAVFKNFNISNAIVTSNKDFIDIYSTGKYENQPFSAEIMLKNSLYKELNISFMDLYLKKYVADNALFNIVDTNSMPDFNNIDFKKYNKITADNINVQLDKFVNGRIVIDNILFTGKAKDGILDFRFNDVLFAEGVLSADGRFDFNNKSLSTNFDAKGVNADIAAYLLYNLKNQIKGKADANFSVTAQGGFENVYGQGSFRITDGYLPNIGSREFVINSKTATRKFSLKDIVKIKQAQTLRPNSILTGNFTIDKTLLKDISLYMQNDAISLYLTGDYDTDSENADFNVWGKYDKKIEHTIKIMHIPLAWVVWWFTDSTIDIEHHRANLMKVPDIKAKSVKSFNVKIDGILSDKKKLKVKVNELK